MQFSKWNTASDGSGTDYTTSISKPDDADVINGTLTLYAIWTEAS